MNIDIDPTLIDPTTLTGPTPLTGKKRPVKDVGTIMSIIFNYVKDIQNRKLEKEITRLTVEAEDEDRAEAIAKAIAKARAKASDEARVVARAEDSDEDRAEDKDELTQLYSYDNPEKITSPTDMIVDTNAKSSSLNLDRGRLETIAVVRCHGDILSPMSIFFENPALANLEPLMKNARLIVSGGFPGVTVVSCGILGANSRWGGCVTVQDTIRDVVDNCQYTDTIDNFNIIVEAAKGYGGLNKEVNFDALIKAKVNPDVILGDYNQTNLVHCLYFSADPEGARLKIKQVINNTVNVSDTENAMMILDPDYKADDFSACAIISVTDQKKKVTLVYNNKTDKTDIFDINNLGCYSNKLQYFFTKWDWVWDIIKMRPFVLKLQFWVHKFIMEWNRLIIHYVEELKDGDIKGGSSDIHFLLKLENLVVVMDIKKNTITYSNTFVQNILIMGFGKWLFGVYQYLQNQVQNQEQNQEQNKKFMTEFMSIFDSNSNSSSINSNNSNEDDKYVNFCENIRNLLFDRTNVVKVIGNFCQVYNKRVYPDNADRDLQNYIEKQKRTIETLWISGKTKTLAAYEAMKGNNYKPAGEAEVTTEDNGNPYHSNSNGNPYPENSNNSNSNTYLDYSYSGRGGKPKSKKQRRQSKKQRRQSKKQRRQGNKRNKYTVKRRW